MSKQRIYTGQIINLDVETVQSPNHTTMIYEMVSHPGGAAVVVVNAQNEICLLKQYRHVMQDWIWEIPAGKLDNQEAAMLCAARELEEEAGVKAANWHSLGQVISSPGVFSEIVYLFLATELTESLASPAADEVFEVHWIGRQKARDMVLSNEVKDAKTVVAILRACEVLDRGLNIHE